MLPFSGSQGGVWGIEAIAAIQMTVTALFLPVTLYLVSRFCRIPAADLVGTLLRPFAAALVMGVAVRIAHVDFPGLPAISLAIDVIFGAAVYTATVLILWLVVGRPEGAERTIVSFLAGAYGRRSSR